MIVSSPTLEAAARRPLMRGAEVASDAVCQWESYFTQRLKAVLIFFRLQRSGYGRATFNPLTTINYAVHKTDSRALEMSL
jgi:hypothetical protein